MQGTRSGEQALINLFPQVQDLAKQVDSLHVAHGFLQPSPAFEVRRTWGTRVFQPTRQLCQADGLLRGQLFRRWKDGSFEGDRGFGDQ